MARDQYGFGVEKISEAKVAANKMAKDHLYVWNRLVENKGPIGIQKDQQDPNPRLQQLMGHEGFMSFLKAKTLENKMIALRDTGMSGNMVMKDEELAQFLMTHVPSGLTEDPQSGKMAKQAVEASV